MATVTKQAYFGGRTPSRVPADLDSVFWRSSVRGPGPPCRRSRDWRVPCAETSRDKRARLPRPRQSASPCVARWEARTRCDCPKSGNRVARLHGFSSRSRHHIGSAGRYPTQESAVSRRTRTSSTAQERWHTLAVPRVAARLLIHELDSRALARPSEIKMPAPGLGHIDYGWEFAAGQEPDALADYRRRLTYRVSGYVQRTVRRAVDLPQDLVGRVAWVSRSQGVSKNRAADHGRRTKYVREL